MFRVRTVQPKMSPGTVRELCIFGPARTGPGTSITTALTLVRPYMAVRFAVGSC